jgi:hypothetical protein
VHKAIHVKIPVMPRAEYAHLADRSFRKAPQERLERRFMRRRRGAGTTVDHTGETNLAIYELTPKEKLRRRKPVDGNDTVLHGMSPA